MKEWLQANRAGATAIAVAIVALILVAAIFGLGPCGDDLSVEEYAERGDEICARAHEEFLDLQDRTPRTSDDAAELVGALIEVAEEERDAIADLSAPASIEESVGAYLEARDRGIDQLQDGQAAAEDEDAEAYERIQSDLEDSQRRRHALAREVGFKECSKPLGRD